MGLTEEVVGAPVIRWTRKAVDAHLGKEAAEEFAALLADPRTNLRVLRQALQRRGMNPSEAAVQKWAYQARYDAGCYEPGAPSVGRASVYPIPDPYEL